VRLRLLSRSPLVYWAAVAALAVVTALVVSQLLGRVRVEAARYGSVRAVVVATRDVALGDPVGAGDVAIRSLPASLVPDDALSELDKARGRIAVVPLFEGQAVLGRQLAPGGRRGVAALLPPGARGIAVPAGPTGARLGRGDTVDVLATFDPATAGAGGTEPTFPVAAGATVIDVAGESVTVSVTPEEAKRVAFAIAHGTVTVVLTTLDESPRR
jgi:Flp pilus assembly protein CpaB